MRSYRRELARELEVRRALCAEGDLNRLISPRTRNVIAKVRIALILRSEPPRWRRAGRGRYDWKSAHGVFTVQKSRHDVWIVKRDDGRFLVHDDGRDALFMFRHEAETAAVMHARDGRDVDDGLRWEEENDLEEEAADEWDRDICWEEIY